MPCFHLPVILNFCLDALYIHQARKLTINFKIIVDCFNENKEVCHDGASLHVFLVHFFSILSLYEWAWLAGSGSFALLSKKGQEGGSLNCGIAFIIPQIGSWAFGQINMRELQKHQTVCNAHLWCLWTNWKASIIFFG